MGSAMSNRTRSNCLRLMMIAEVTCVPAFGFGTTATTTTLTVTSGGSSVTTVALGTEVTLTATVANGSTAITAGQVMFCDATAAYCEDIDRLGTAQLLPARPRPPSQPESPTILFRRNHDAEQPTSSYHTNGSPVSIRCRSEHDET